MDSVESLGIYDDWITGMSEAAPPARARLTSLDQFRGYTIIGMLLVNFFGSYNCCYYVLEHKHDYCSYADTIMPQFLFAVGYAMQLGAAKMALADPATRWKRIIRRFIGLSLVAILFYSWDDGFKEITERIQANGFMPTLGALAKRTWFQTLLHISVTGLWIAPVVGKSAGVRIVYMLFSGLAHVWLSWKFNFSWTHGLDGSPGGIDGGPLGFLTWTSSAILGTFACDIMKSGMESGAIIRRLVGWGVAVAAVAWLVSSLTTLYNVEPIKNADGSFPAWYGKADVKLAIDPVIPSQERLKLAKLTLPELPFVPPPPALQPQPTKENPNPEPLKNLRQGNYWMMSQRAGSWTYTAYAGGLAMVIMAFFYWLSDLRGVTFGIFRTLGTNSLVAYMMQPVSGMILRSPGNKERAADWLQSTFGLANRPSFDQDATPFWAIASLLAHITIIYAVCRFLEWRKWYVRM